MQKAVILTEEEYNSLLSKDRIDENLMEYLQACEFTLNAYAIPTRICPKCRKAMLLQGYVCFNCGYDDSDNEEEDFL